MSWTRVCIICLLCLLCLRSADAFGAPPTPSIVPQPVTEILSDRPGFSPGASVAVVTVVPLQQRAEVKRAAETFARWLRPVAGVPVFVSARSLMPTIPAIVLTTTGAPAALGSEGYTLTVRATGVIVRARQAAGLFYGLQSLRQLFPPSAESGRRLPKSFTLPAVSITDQPRFPVRSVMLDSARHFQSIGFLKKTIDQMAYHKLNRFHWHLTDDQGWRLEIKKYPRLTGIGGWRVEAGDKRYGGYYTQAQVRDLVSYARDRYVTIQPEIDMPAHIQSALAAYPEIACFPRPFIVSTAGVSANGIGTPDVLCAGKTNAFRFVTDVLTEVMALFPSKEIHIGGDECSKVRWKVCPFCQARIKEKWLKDETALQNDFTQRIAAFLGSRGRRLQGWNEIEEGGSLPKNVVVQLWNNPSTLERSAAAGRDIVYSHTPSLYLDQDPASLTTDRVYATEPLPVSASPGARRHLLGLEACLWTERRNGDATTDDYLWPRAAALAEAAWSPKSVRNWADFRERLVSSHLERMARFSVEAGTSENWIAARQQALYERGALAVGMEAGQWNPGMMSRTVVTREWEITKLLNSPGLWRVQPRYTGGAHALAVSEIALIRRSPAPAPNGTETLVAKDTHEGWSGGAIRDSVYRLRIPDWDRDRNARYFLRVRLRSDGGTDSHGIILLFPPE